MRRIFTQLPYFIPEDPAFIRELFLQHGVRRTIARGEALKRGGDRLKLFLLEEGLCAYYAGVGFGRPTILAVILPGRTMGDLSASAKIPCNVYTAALMPSRVIEMPAEALYEAFQQHPELAEEQIANVIKKEEALLEGMVANFTRPPAERVAVFAKALIRTTHAGPDKDGWFSLPLLISAQVIGEAVNLNRVSVAKIIARWLKIGLAKREKKHLVLSPELLEPIDDWIENSTGASTLGFNRNYSTK